MQTTPLIIALIVCVVGAGLEGVFAGSGLRARMNEIRMPAFSPPFLLWIFIGVAYYAICFVVMYRLMVLPSSGQRNLALGLAAVVLFTNALWNLYFFRKRDLRASFAIGMAYSMVGWTLLALLFRLDRVAAYTFLPYGIYLVYANVWSYRLIGLNHRR